MKKGKKKFKGKVMGAVAVSAICVVSTVAIIATLKNADRTN